MLEAQLEVGTKGPALQQAPSLRGGSLLLGHLPGMQADPIGLISRAMNELGDVVHFRVGYKNLFMLRDPEHIKYLLQDHYKAFSKQTRGYAALRTVLGNGLVTSEGDFWLRQRRIAQPAFHRQRISEFARTIASLTDDMLTAWTKHPNGQVLDVADEMMALTLRIVGHTLLSTEISDAAPVVKNALGDMLHEVIKRTTAVLPIPLRIPTPPNVRLNRARAALDAIVHRVIAERRASGEDKGDLLGMLMQARDEETGEGMTDVQLRDEVMTIFLAGHETTANALTWTFYLLSKHPDIARRLREEVTATLAGRTPAFEDLPQLKYTSMVVQESMRLYPPVWILMRLAEGDQAVGGYRIPDGSFIGASPYVCHRNPRYFPDPEAFQPERFTPENVAKLPRFAYFPFSGGPRICIGNNFAMMEAQLILAAIVQRFSLELLPDHPVEMEPVVTLRPKYGMKMRLAAT